MNTRARGQGACVNAEKRQTAVFRVPGWSNTQPLSTLTDDRPQGDRSKKLYLVADSETARAQLFRASGRRRVTIAM